MRISRILMVLLAVGVFISLFLFFLVIPLNFFINQEKTEQSPIPSKTFLYQEIDSSTSSFDYSSLGFVTLQQTLSDDDFITYTSTNGNQIIISHFAPSQFKCQGSCFCSSEKRRTSSNILSRPLFLIISAISSTIALKIAEKTFHNQCLLQISSTCDEENIESSVSSCSEEEEETSQKSELEYSEYSCEGHCIPKKFSKPDTESAQEKYLSRNKGCEELKTSGNVKIKRIGDEKGTTKHILKGGREKVYKHKYHFMYTKARHRFSKVFLTPFCKGMSRKGFWYTQPSNGRRSRREVSMCIGGGTSKDFPDGRLEYPFQNIKCVMIKKKTTS